MKIKLKSLCLNTYDIHKKKYCRFVREITTDPLVNKFVPTPIELQLLESKNDDIVKIPSSYIVTEKKELVGYVRFNELDELGTLILHYAVHPDYRRNGYGSKILIEVSDYVFKNMNEVSKIKLHINSINKGSIKCAENAKFVKQKNRISTAPFVYIKVK